MQNSLSASDISTQPLHSLLAERAKLAEKLLKSARAKRFDLYAPTNLKIRTKSGSVAPLTLNTAQRYLHERLEDQKTKTGRVRALILKGRQQGCSTYVEGRYYWLTSRNPGSRAFILAHERDASNNLFDIANRYWENDPDAPEADTANAKELDFAELDSGYRVATAGTKDVGRSQTVQFFHGSEVAFWPDGSGHAGGVLQAVPDLDGTEIMLESTANGVGGFFHQEWQKAEAGISDYQAIFIPWYWQEEYRRTPPKEFSLSSEEAEYQTAYGLSLDQMYWRRMKVVTLGSETLFKQEYPANAAEAFQISGEDRYIAPELVLRARKTKCEPRGPLIIGADPCRFGDDRFGVAFRRGRRLVNIEAKQKLDVVAGANWLKQIIDTHKPSRVFVDVGGLGAGTFDILISWGEPYSKIVKAINFGGAPQEPEILIQRPDGEIEKRPGPLNRRAEMWKRSKDWLEAEGGAQIPDSDSLQADACGPKFKYDMQQRLVLESKEQMRLRGIRSPDEWDAVALTFAEPVAEQNTKPLDYSAFNKRIV
jgi:hypothetical protein